MTMSATHAHRRGPDCFHVCFMFETLRVRTNPACFPCVLHSQRSQPSRDAVLLCCRVYTARGQRACTRCIAFSFLRATGSFGRFNHRSCISALACISERASFVRTKAAAGIGVLLPAIDTVPLFSGTERTIRGTRGSSNARESNLCLIMLECICLMPRPI